MNPNGVATTYHIDYGLTSGYEAEHPRDSRRAPAPARWRSSAALTGLEPGHDLPLPSRRDDRRPETRSASTRRSGPRNRRSTAVNFTGTPSEPDRDDHRHATSDRTRRPNRPNPSTASPATPASTTARPACTSRRLQPGLDCRPARRLHRAAAGDAHRLDDLVSVRAVLLELQPGHERGLLHLDGRRGHVQRSRHVQLTSELRWSGERRLPVHRRRG